MRQSCYIVFASLWFANISPSPRPTLTEKSFPTNLHYGNLITAADVNRRILSAAWPEIWPKDICLTDIWPTNIWPTDIWRREIWQTDIWPNGLLADGHFTDGHNKNQWSMWYSDPRNGVTVKYFQALPFVPVSDVAETFTELLCISASLTLRFPLIFPK